MEIKNEDQNISFGKQTNDSQLISQSNSSQNDNEHKYDPYQIPADIVMARLHNQCNRFGRPPDLMNKESVVLCPCCHKARPEEVPLSLPCSKLDFSGPTLPMLFQFTKYLACLGLGYLVIGIYLHYRYIQVHCVLMSEYRPGISCPSKLGDFIPQYDHEQMSHVTPVWPWIIVFTFLVTVTFYWRQDVLAKSIRRRERFSAADYTIMIQELNASQMNEEYLLTVLMRHAPDTQIDIEKITYFTCRGAQKLAQHELQEEREHLDRLTGKLEKCEDLEQRTGLERTLVMAEKHVKKLAESRLLKANISEINSIAFITLKTIEQASQVSRTSLLRYYLYQWFFCCHKRKVHWVEQAPEPEDVNWKAAGVSFKLKIISSLLSSLITIASFIVIGWVYYELHQLDRYIYSCKHQNKTWAKVLFPIMWMTPTVMVIINKLLISVAELMVHLETHVTENQRIVSLTRKYYKLQLWNTFVGFLVSLAIHFYLIQANIDIENMEFNLGKKFMTIMLSQIFLGPFLDAYRLSYLFSKVIPKWRIEQDLSKGKHANVTQRQLNSIFDPPQMEFNIHYASYLRSFMVTVCVYPFCPIVSMLFIGCIFAHFWTNKYMALRRNKKIGRLDPKLACQVTDSLQFSFTAMLLVYLLMCRLSEEDKTSKLKSLDANQTTVVILLIIINMSISLRSISVRAFNCIIRPRKSHVDTLTHTHTSYHDISHQLHADYDRLNPMTRKYALSDWKSKMMVNDKNDESSLL